MVLLQVKLSTGSLQVFTGIVGKYRANPVENIQQFLNYSDPDHTIVFFLNSNEGRVS